MLLRKTKALQRSSVVAAAERKDLLRTPVALRQHHLLLLLSRGGLLLLLLLVFSHDKRSRHLGPEKAEKVADSGVALDAFHAHELVGR